MLEDKDIALFLVRWGSDVRVLVVMVFLLIVLIALNIWLWRRSKRVNETVIEWTQNLEELEVDFPIPAGATARDVTCKIMPTTIYFAIKGHATPMLDGSFFRKVKCEECNWQLWPVGAPTMVKLTLVKQREGHWTSVLAEDNKKSS